MNDIRKSIYSEVPISKFRVWMLFAFFSLTGIMVVPLIKTSFIPNNNTNVISTTFRWPNTPAEVIENKATSIIEAQLSSLKDIERIESYSEYGFGKLRISFNRDANILVKQHATTKQIRRIQSSLSDEIRFGPVEIETSNQNEMIVALSSDKPLPEFVEDAEILINELTLLKGIEPRKKWSFLNETYLKELTNLSKHLFNQVSIKTAISQSQNIGFIGNLNSTPIKIREVEHSNPLKWISIENESGSIYKVEELFSVIEKVESGKTRHQINGDNTLYLDIKNHNTNKLYANFKLKSLLHQKKLALKDRNIHLRIIHNPIEKLSSDLFSMLTRALLSILCLSIVLIVSYKKLSVVTTIIAAILINTCCSLLSAYLLQIELNMFSVAGFALSFGLTVDNFIITAELYQKKNFRKLAFTLIATTLTSIGTSVSLFWIPKEDALLMRDFVFMVSINLGCSIFSSLLFLPTLINSTSNKGSLGLSFLNTRKIQAIKRSYIKVLDFNYEWRKVILITLILLFGVPIYLLPKKLNSEILFSQYYNNAIGSSFYQENISPSLNFLLGGLSFRFYEKIGNSNRQSLIPEDLPQLQIFSENHLPTNPDQIEKVYLDFQSLLSERPEISQAISTINEQSFQINIYFKEGYSNTSFPIILAGVLDHKAQQYSGIKFRINANEISFNSGSILYNNSGIRLTGYSYKDLIQITNDIKRELKKNNRIENIALASDGKSEKGHSISFHSDNPFHVSLTPSEINELQQNFNNGKYLVYNGNLNGESRTIWLLKPEIELWDLKSKPIGQNSINKRLSRISDILVDKKEPYIHRINQEYIVDLTFDYLGPDIQASKFLKQFITKIQSYLPVGYLAEEAHNGQIVFSLSNQKLAILISFCIIFIISAILLESVKIPFRILLFILISFVGIFTIFLGSSTPFGLGALVGSIFLCGLVINNVFYLLLCFKEIQIQDTNISNTAISEILLTSIKRRTFTILITTLTSIAGLIPFLILDSSNTFWYQFSLSTLCGLIASLILLFFFLPTIFGRSLLNYGQNKWIP